MAWLNTSDRVDCYCRKFVTHAEQLWNTHMRAVWAVISCLLCDINNKRYNVCHADETLRYNHKEGWGLYNVSKKRVKTTYQRIYQWSPWPGLIICWLSSAPARIEAVSIKGVTPPSPIKRKGQVTLCAADRFMKRNKKNEYLWRDPITLNATAKLSLLLSQISSLKVCRSSTFVVASTESASIFLLLLCAPGLVLCCLITIIN